MKLKVREKSISYAAYKNVATKKREEMLEREIALVEKHLDNVNKSNSSYHIVAERIFSLKKRTRKHYSVSDQRRYHQVKVAMVKRG